VRAGFAAVRLRSAWLVRSCDVLVRGSVDTRRRIDYSPLRFVRAEHARDHAATRSQAGRPLPGRWLAVLACAAGGGGASRDAGGLARLPKPAELPPFGDSAEGHRIRRVRRLDDVPVALEEIWLDGAQVRRITAADLSESLYLFYRDRLGLLIARIEDRVGLAPAPDWLDAPGVLPPGPVGFIERISWSQAGESVEASRTWFDTDKARYVSRLSEG